MAIRYTGTGVFKYGLDIQGQFPLDSRIVVNYASDLDNYKAVFVSGGVPTWYVGMVVFAEDTKKLYVLESEESGFKPVGADESQLANLFTYKGNVSTYAELASKQTTAKIGDVYNVEDAFTIGELENAKTYPAGTNVVWNGTSWDTLGGSVDLSNYVTKLELQNNNTILNQTIESNRTTLLGVIDGKVDKETGKRLITDEEAQAIVDNTANITAIQNMFKGTGDGEITIDLGELQAQINTNTSALQNKVDKNTYEGHLTTINTNITTNTNSINTLSGQVSGFEGRLIAVESLKGTVSELSANMSGILPAANAYTDTKLGSFTSDGVDASGLRKEIEERDQATLAAAGGLVNGVQNNLNSHANNTELHLAAGEREAWTAAANAINTFLADADMTTNAVDTLKELQSYMTSDGAAATELLSRVSALETADTQILASISNLSGSLGTMAYKNANDYYTQTETNAQISAAFEWHNVDE